LVLACHGSVSRASCVRSFMTNPPYQLEVEHRPHLRALARWTISSRSVVRRGLCGPDSHECNQSPDGSFSRSTSSHYNRHLAARIGTFPVFHVSQSIADAIAHCWSAPDTISLCARQVLSGRRECVASRSSDFVEAPTDERAPA
jgi:hypothetical protein